MNVFHKVTLQSLRRNKVRTVVTIIGIMLSAAMICAVTTFISSIQNYMLNYAFYTEGNWHGMVTDVGWEDYRGIHEDEAVSYATYSQGIGYAKVDSQNQFKPYLYVVGGEKDRYFDTMPVHLISGRYPADQSEIILPDHAFTNGGLNYKAGDTLTLAIGERMLDGYSMNQNNPCYVWDETANKDVWNGETLSVRETRTYTVVGIYKRPSFENRSAPGYTALTVADGQHGDAFGMDVYFRMHKPSEVYDYMKGLALAGRQNTDVLLYNGITRYNSITSVLIRFAVIVIGLIMLGSVSLIYNAFAISVSERTKQFGLLSSIGATRRQLKKMVLFEALAVSAVGIPLGIGVGIAGIGVTLLLIGEKFASAVSGYSAPLRMCVSWKAVVAAVVVALITVLISVWIPSKRATKISAVEAIRQNGDIKAKNRRTKTSKLTYRLFGLPGVIASKHYKRNRRKYRTTVISLFMSIVLFVSASAFCNYLIESVNGGYASNDYQLYYAYPHDAADAMAPEELLRLLTSEPNVTRGACVEQENFSALLDGADITEEFRGMTWEQDGRYVLNGSIYFVDDAEFDKLLSDNQLDREAYHDPANPRAVAVDHNRLFDGSQGKFVTVDVLRHGQVTLSRQSLKVFDGYSCVGEERDEDGSPVWRYEDPLDRSDFLLLSYEEAFDSEPMQIGQVITKAPFYLDRVAIDPLQLLYPMSMMEAVLPQEFVAYSVFLQSDNHAASYEGLKAALLEKGLSYERLHDYAADKESSNNFVLVIQVFAYGFIVLISLIAAANVFNTISTNISLRRREFAMLKSVGMAQSGFNKMMNYECLLYGTKALLLGLPVSAGVTYLMYRSIQAGYETTYQLPWSAIGIAAFSVFLVVFATMVYAMRKIKKDNPIDALKNENL